jgi:hypothetical protein
MTIEERLARLERKNRRLKLLDEQGRTQRSLP